MNEKKHDLTERDCKMLEHVARYRIATDAIFRTVFFPNVQDNGPPRKVAVRLVENKYLREFRIKGTSCYYVLAPRGARLLKLKPKEPRPFTEQSLPGALAVAYYCATRGIKRFTAREFGQKFPELCRPGLRCSSYFLEETGGGLCLSSFLLDRGATARRLQGKIRNVIRQRYALKPFASLIQAGRFQIVVLTGYQAKQKELQTDLAKRHRGPVKVRVEVVPELGSFLSGG